ncbi:ABC transporter permease [Falsiroseomonas tokyonensis]|uniref:FtsX-like permease family protein n=1 Tax=Falsiroseomonas tokyonensis TaxID=430521 RepID=A0ABV7C154_9PROT|nr:ABC transporter permease [Falsiroseomonas tokyonensis]
MLDRKMLRDVLALRGQVLTIALLIGAGVAVLVMSVGTFLSLRGAQQTFYAQSHFAEVFAEVKRAPRTLLPQIAEIPGVAIVEGRVTGEARVDWPGAEVPVAGRIVSLPLAGGQPALNRLRLLVGRLPEPTRHEEAVIHAAFAEARRVRPGEEIAVILNGRRQSFRIVGIAHSPEFVFTSRPGSPLPDDRGYVLLFVNETAVARAFDMQGAFSELVLTLAPGASEPAVIAELDRLLQPWGGRGAHGRRDQPSHRFLEDELAEQRTLAVTVPLIFFGIAAFLLNVVLGRMVEAQREQVAALKALGYPSFPIAAHYAKFVAVVCGLGAALGVAAGAWMGEGMLGNYRPFFRFPEMPYLLPAWLPLLAAAASFAFALLGVLAALRRILRLPAAEGLRPPRPAALGAGALGSVGGRLSARAKIPLRGLLGRPIRTGLTMLGIALAVPMVVLGLFWWDALDSMVALQFDRIERGDAFVALTDPRPARAVREMARLPGVLAVEGQRIVPVRLRAAQRSHLLALSGLPEGATLRVPRDADLRPVQIPREGVALSRRLAERLGVREGDRVQVEVLEGARRSHDLPVVALVEDIIGLTALMEIGALNRLLREDDLISHVALRVDPLAAQALWQLLAERPRVAATSVKAVWLRVFDEVIARMVLTSAVILTGFGIIIAVGVVYNSARVALQERGWEMASLRVLGFTRQEVARLLLGELAVAVLIAVPLGLALAQGFVALILGARNNESFDIPATISPATFATAALVVLGAAAASAIVVRRRIDRLDLVAALKARE